MSDDIWQVYEKRLLVLEERTRPKPKRLSERLQAGCALVIALVAVLYTTPISFWDRYVLSGQQRSARQTEELRAAIVEIARLDRSFVVDRSAVPEQDAEGRSFFDRAASVQKLIAFTRIERLIDGREELLTVPELMFPAYVAGTAQRSDQASRLLRIADRMSANQPLMMRADIARLRAGVTLNNERQPRDQRFNEFRSLMMTNVTLLRDAREIAYLPQIGNSLIQLGQFEAAFGEPACADLMTHWLRRALDQTPPTPELRLLRLRVQGIPSIAQGAVGPCTLAEYASLRD